MQRNQQDTRLYKSKDLYPDDMQSAIKFKTKHLINLQANNLIDGPALFFICLLMLVFSSLTYASIILDAGWEDGGFNDYYFNVSRNKYGATIVDAATTDVPSCTGTRSLKSELIYGKGSVWSQVVLNIEPFNSFENAKEHWFAFAVYLPDSYLPDDGYEDLIWELHGRPDSADGELSRNAPVAIRTKGDQWLITYIKDSNYITYKAGDIKKVYEERAYKTIGQFQTGRWTIFAINTLYDYRPRGFLKIWKDGDLVIDKSSGIGFNDQKGPFVRMGIYKSSWDMRKDWGSATNVSSRVAYFDDFRVGDANTSYEQIAPVCDSTSPPKLKPPTGLKLEIFR